MSCQYNVYRKCKNRLFSQRPRRRRRERRDWITNIKPIFYASALSAPSLRSLREYRTTHARTRSNFIAITRNKIYHLPCPWRSRLPGALGERESSRIAWTTITTHFLLGQCVPEMQEPFILAEGQYFRACLSIVCNPLNVRPGFESCFSGG